MKCWGELGLLEADLAIAQAEPVRFRAADAKNIEGAEDWANGGVWAANARRARTSLGLVPVGAR